MDALAPRSDQHSTDVFVGRDALLAEAQLALARARQGRGSAFWLVGEAGIGKTRTGFELARRAEGFRVLHARCPEDRSSPAFWPWVQVLREREADGGGDRQRGLGDLLRRLPELADLPLHREAGASLESSQQRFLVFDTIVRELVRWGEREPLLLVFDDLHWSDLSSLLLLDQLAGELHTARILLVGAYRGSELTADPRLTDSVAALASHGCSREVELRPLDRDSAAAIIRAIVPGGTSEAVIDHVYGLTEGNPFFIEQISRLLADESPAEPREPARDAVLPRGVLHSIRRRLHRLDGACIAALRMASVLGREFALATLQRALDSGTDALLEHLEAARAIALVEQTAVPGRWRFDHVLIQKALYDELTPLARARAHDRIAQLLEAKAGEPSPAVLAELAHHSRAAIPVGAVERAVEYSHRAGRAAAASLAWEQAVVHFEQALALCDGAARVDPRRQLPLLLDLADAQRLASRAEEAAGTFRHAFALGEALREGEVMARAALGEGEAAFVFGQTEDDLGRRLEESMAQLPDIDSGLRARLLARLALTRAFDHPAEAEQLIHNAIAMARRLGDPAALAYALIRRHWMSRAPEHLDDRRALAAEVMELAAGVGDRWMDLEGRAFCMVGCIERGELARFDAELEVFALRAAALAHPRHLSSVPRWRSLRALLQGDFDGAERHAREALEVGMRFIPAQALHGYAAQLVALRRDQGRLDEIADLVREQMRRYPAIHPWQCVMALVEAELGRLPAAREQLDELAAVGFERILRGGIAGPALLAEVAARLGDRAVATRLYELLAPHAGLIVETGLGLFAVGPLDHFLGLLAAAHGARAAAIAHFEKALQTAERLRARPWAVRSALALAEILAADAATKSRAVELRRRALDEARALGMQGVLRVAAPTDVGAVAGPEEEADQVFRRAGEYWVMHFGGRGAHVRHQIGLQYVAELLRHPGRDVHALALVAATAGLDGAPASGDAGPLIDAEARRVYRSRLQDLRAELEQARGFNDVGRVAQLTHELCALEAELRRAIGLDGRARRAGSAGERARINVTRSVRKALRRIDAAHPELGAHLAATVRTGMYLSYRPDPRASERWQL